MILLHIEMKRPEVDILGVIKNHVKSDINLYILYFKRLTSKGEMGPVNNY